MQNKKAAAPSKKAQPPDCRFTWERDVLQRGLDVVMSGAVTNNCFHQGERPQNDLAQDLGRLDTYRVHAVDAEQDQTCDTTAQNVIRRSRLFVLHFGAAYGTIRKTPPGGLTLNNE